MNDLKQLIFRLKDQLFQIEETDGNLRISLPHPNIQGERVNLLIQNILGKIRVTDDRYAYTSVADIGKTISDRSISAKAANISKQFGIPFKDKSFQIDVEENQLEAAVMWVSKASLMLADDLLLSETELRLAYTRAIVDESFTMLKYDNRISRNVEIVGASNKTHKVDYLLTENGRKYLFEISLSRSQSVNKAFTMFSDIRKREEDLLIEALVEANFKQPDINLLASVSDHILRVEQQNILARNIDRVVSGLPSISH